MKLKTESFENVEEKRKVPFFEIQIEFAKQVSKLKDISFEQALLENTSIYKEFNLPWPLNKEDEFWKKYLEKIKDKTNEKEIAQITYNQYAGILNNGDIKKEKVESKEINLFDYVYNLNEKEVRLHFHPPKGKKFSLTDANEVLSVSNSFKVFLEKIKSEHPEAQKISATSWLLGIDALSYMFPEEFRSSFKQEKNYMASLAMWGQFLKNDGIREEAVLDFKKKFKTARNMDEIEDAFPLKVFTGSCDISKFYKKYEVTP